jgi:hypothetical protein
MFKGYKFLFSTLLAGLLSLTACKKDEVIVDFNYEYFDLTEGRFMIYDVTEIRHDEGAFVKHDTSYYQLKTVIGDTVIDNIGRISREFLRYTRISESDPWILKDVWTSIIDQNRAELVEENQRVVKLVFKPTINKSWNANAFNTFEPLDCYYKNLHDPFQLNSLFFDSTLTVEQDDFFTLVDYRRKFEVYAKGVGLIKKYYKDLGIQNFDTVSGVKNGKELFYNLRSYGVQ